MCEAPNAFVLDINIVMCALDGKSFHWTKNTKRLLRNDFEYLPLLISIIYIRGHFPKLTFSSFINSLAQNAPTTIRPRSKVQMAVPVHIDETRETQNWHFASGCSLRIWMTCDYEQEFFLRTLPKHFDEKALRTDQFSNFFLPFRHLLRSRFFECSFEGLKSTYGTIPQSAKEYERKQNPIYLSVRLTNPNSS